MGTKSKGVLGEMGFPAEESGQKERVGFDKGEQEGDGHTALDSSRGGDWDVKLTSLIQGQVTGRQSNNI